MHSNLKSYFLLLKNIFLILFVFLSFITTVQASLSWTNRTIGTAAEDLSWQAITSSSDGTKLAAVQNGGGGGGDIWTSINSGVTWTNRTTGTPATPWNWLAITSSSDGTKLAAAALSGNIWTSVDSGITWVNKTAGTAAADLGFSAITSSEDGEVIITASDWGDIWISTDGGTTWDNKTTGTSATGFFWTSFDTNSDASIIVGSEVGNGNVWLSTDSGETWVDKTAGTPAAAQYVASVALPNTTTIVFVVGYVYGLGSEGGGNIWMSTDSGTTWNNKTEGTLAASKAWTSVIVSADATELFASAEGGDIWTSTNSGVSWTNTTTGTSASGSTWRGLTSSDDLTKLAIVAQGGNIWTGQPSDTTAPTISSIASSTAATTATITWTTDEVATSTLAYGLTASYGATSTIETATTSHSISLTGLTAETAYHFKITSRDASGNTASSSDLIFTTATAPVTPAPAETTVSGGSYSGGGSVAMVNSPEVRVLRDFFRAPNTTPATAPNAVSTAVGLSAHKNVFTTAQGQAFVFGRNMTVSRTSSTDIQKLQIFLNAVGFTVSKTGAGSPGFETRRFGAATRAALARYQKANGITPAVGYFGPITRGYVNAFLKGTFIK